MFAFLRSGPSTASQERPMPWFCVKRCALHIYSFGSTSTQARRTFGFTQPPPPHGGRAPGAAQSKQRAPRNHHEALR
eukprot:5927869-Amphidinium_carterae.2